MTSWSRPSRLTATLAAVLLWLAPAGSRVYADVLTYTFSGQSDFPAGFTVNGSFQVDTATIQSKAGVLTAPDLQNPLFHVSDGHDFNAFLPSSTFTVNPVTYAVESADLHLASADQSQTILNITGAGVYRWEEVSDSPVSGQGSWSGSPQAVPVPPSLALLGLGALCLAGHARRRWRKAA